MAARYEEGLETRRQGGGDPWNDLAEPVKHRNGFMYRPRDRMISPLRSRCVSVLNGAGNGTATTLLPFVTSVNVESLLGCASSQQQH